MDRGSQVKRVCQDYISCLKAVGNATVCLRAVRFPVEAAATFIHNCWNTEGMSTCPAKCFARTLINFSSMATQHTSKRCIDPSAKTGRRRRTHIDLPSYIWKHCGHVCVVQHPQLFGACLGYVSMKKEVTGETRSFLNSHFAVNGKERL